VHVRIACVCVAPATRTRNCYLMTRRAKGNSTVQIATPSRGLLFVLRAGERLKSALCALISRRQCRRQRRCVCRRIVRVGWPCRHARGTKLGVPIHELPAPAGLGCQKDLSSCPVGEHCPMGGSIHQPMIRARLPKTGWRSKGVLCYGASYAGCAQWLHSLRSGGMI